MIMPSMLERKRKGNTRFFHRLTIIIIYRLLSFLIKFSVLRFAELGINK